MIKELDDCRRSKLINGRLVEMCFCFLSVKEDNITLRVAFDDHAGPCRISHTFCQYDIVEFVSERLRHDLVYREWQDEST